MAPADWDEYTSHQTSFVPLGLGSMGCLDCRRGTHAHKSVP